MTKEEVKPHLDKVKAETDLELGLSKLREVLIPHAGRKSVRQLLRFTVFMAQREARIVDLERAHIKEYKALQSLERSVAKDPQPLSDAPGSDEWNVEP